MNTRETELKPCPLCNGQPLGVWHEAHTHKIALWMPDHPGSYSIECPPCDLLLIKDTREEAAEAWNRRAQ